MNRDIKGLLFNLHNTLAYIEDPVDDVELSNFLVSKGYEIYPQSLQAAFHYVSVIEYPKRGFKGWRSYLSRVFYRLGYKLDDETMSGVIDMFNKTRWVAFPDSFPALEKAKNAGLKTAIVSTIACFMYKKQLKDLLKSFNLIVDAYKCGCEKSNPRMYLYVLQQLGLEPEDVIMIGDNIYLDVVVPSKIGIDSILLVRHGAPPSYVKVAKNLEEAIDMALAL